VKATTEFDAAIIGGGIAGATLSLAVAQAGLRVALVEEQPLVTPVVPAAPAELRVSAITLASRAIFGNLGVWPVIAAQRVSPIHAMHVWDAAGGGAIDFDAADLAEPCLGYIIENRAMSAALHAMLRDHENVTLFCPARLAGLRLAPEAAELALADGRAVRARLAVGADGAASRVRELAGIATQGWSYGQKAIVATVATETPHRATAHQVFLDSGPLAFLPLANGQCSIVWSCDNARADALAALDDESFIRELNAAFGASLGAITLAGRRGLFPLAAAHADHLVTERLALIGDAAHRIHPLAGQGLNLGLKDAALLAGVIIDAQRTHRDIGALAVLRAYERGRKADTLRMLAAMEAFRRGFGVLPAPLVALRSLGLRAMDRLAPLKRLLMREAVGLSGELPPLARRALL
jgi:2-octaprenylphenol hydroxylase